MGTAIEKVTEKLGIGPTSVAVDGCRYTLFVLGSEEGEALIQVLEEWLAFKQRKNAVYAV